MTDDAVATCTQDIVAPIIFIPGIMGSRLRRTSDGEVVWNPGIDGWEQLGNTADLFTRGAGRKRNRLVGDSGSYFDKDFLEVAHRSDGGIEDRGWTGMLPTYSRVRNLLNGEKHGYVNGCLVFTKLVLWFYPYNWTGSNLDSARDPQNAAYGNLETVIARAAADAKEQAEQLGRQAVKPIIVTHSMGGLVARAFTEIMGKGDQVHGVIHGAMPTHGSPELYKRIKGGFEGLTKGVLGGNGPEVTATAGNCPGPLELAPSKWYKGAGGRSDWISAVVANGSNRSIPRSDPYSEIYRNQSDYWRLIIKEWLNPVGDPSGDFAYIQYLSRIAVASGFHDALGEHGFHPNTRMFYGTGLTTRDRIDWTLQRLNGALPASGTFSGEYTTSNEFGRMRVRGTPDPGFSGLYGGHIVMSGPNAPGDGTVQAGAGSHSGQMAVPIDDGFEHQAAFDSRAAREQTLAWLSEMIEEMAV